MRKRIWIPLVVLGGDPLRVIRAGLLPYAQRQAQPTQGRPT